MALNMAKNFSDLPGADPKTMTRDQARHSGFLTTRNEQKVGVLLFQNNIQKDYTTNDYYFN